MRYLALTLVLMPKQHTVLVESLRGAATRAGMSSLEPDQSLRLGVDLALAQRVASAHEARWAAACPRLKAMAGPNQARIGAVLGEGRGP
jgi:hypothetical protein